MGGAPYWVGTVLSVSTLTMKEPPHLRFALVKCQLMSATLHKRKQMQIHGTVTVAGYVHTRPDPSH